MLYSASGIKKTPTPKKQNPTGQNTSFIPQPPQSGKQFCYNTQEKLHSNMHTGANPN